MQYNRIDITRDPFQFFRWVKLFSHSTLAVYFYLWKFHPWKHYPQKNYLQKIYPQKIYPQKINPQKITLEKLPLKNYSWKKYPRKNTLKKFTLKRLSSKINPQKITLEKINSHKVYQSNSAYTNFFSKILRFCVVFLFVFLPFKFYQNVSVLVYPDMSLRLKWLKSWFWLAAWDWTPLIGQFYSKRFTILTNLKMNYIIKHFLYNKWAILCNDVINNYVTITYRACHWRLAARSKMLIPKCPI